MLAEDGVSQLPRDDDGTRIPIEDASLTMSDGAISLAYPIAVVSLFGPNLCARPCWLT